MNGTTAWGTDTFGNGDALDFLMEVVEQPGIEPVRRAIAQAAAGPLPLTPAAQALAALEVLAAVHGKPTRAAKNMDDLIDWVGTHKPQIDAALLAQAKQALENLAAPDSALHAVYRAHGTDAAWLQSVAELRANLA